MKQGKVKGYVKSVHPKNPKLNELVCFELPSCFQVGKVVELNDFRVEVQQVLNKNVFITDADNVSVLVVESVNMTGKGTVQIPLKYSQWEAAIKNDEVNNPDKPVECEIKPEYWIDADGSNRVCFSLEEVEQAGGTYIHKPSVAKIIPAKKKVYSQEEVNHLLDSQACRTTAQMLDKKDRPYTNGEVRQLFTAWNNKLSVLLDMSDRQKVEINGLMEEFHQSKGL